MFRILTAGLTALILAACQPAEPAASTEPPTSPTAAAPPAPAEPVFDGAAFAAMEARYLGKDKPTDPIEEFDWREVTCNFLGGEIGGDPGQDKAIIAELDELRCGEQSTEARALRAANANDPSLVARIDAYLARNPDPAL